MEKVMAPHSSTLSWKIPWTEEPGGLQSIASQTQPNMSRTLHFSYPQPLVTFVLVILLVSMNLLGASYKWNHTGFILLCLTLSDPMDCDSPGSSVHGIFQAGVLEWVAISFSSA